MARTLNGIANLTAFAGVILLTVGAVWGTFHQGWGGWQILAANGCIVVAFGMFLGWIAHVAKRYQF